MEKSEEYSTTHFLYWSPAVDSPKFFVNLHFHCTWITPIFHTNKCFFHVSSDWKSNHFWLVDNSLLPLITNTLKKTKTFASTITSTAWHNDTRYKTPSSLICDFHISHLYWIQALSSLFLMLCLQTFIQSSLLPHGFRNA